MAIIELYSTRKKKNNGGNTDVYQYDELSAKLKTQILQIIFDILDRYSDNRRNYHDENEYDFLRNALCREYGRFTLNNENNARSDLIGWFLNKADTDEQLDFVELSFRYLELVVQKDSFNYIDDRGNRLSPRKIKDAIEELNHRIKEDTTGYQYIESTIIRVDSQYIHSDVVKPALSLLRESDAYDGASDEFLSAHEHYRHGNYKECLVDCLKSFESLMKAIHIKRSWHFDPKKATAKDLINGCLKNGLIPQYLQNQMSAINNMLDSGIPTIRNKEAGHGQGAEVSQVEEHLCSYMIHITASNLLFLAECERSM
ncbi:STM4504/CBY_0614 family protein [Enterobacter sp. 148H3]|uniref:STM4504/CBY_0614 family protein n=1 Tax=Enterobacter sp. 148H3 TaxID=3077756 RepID=UPI0015EB555B|nr:hypothetical protein [Enterobacter sp. 148H3]